MKVTEAFKGNFIESLHVAGKAAVMVIKDYDAPNSIKASDGRLIDNPILRFKNTDKGLILNKTNARTIGLALGNEMDDWKGHKIKLFQDKCDAFGNKNTPCVRVRVVRGGDA